MIESFKHKGLKLLFEKGDASRLNAEHAGKLRLILSVLDAADSIEDVDQPALRLHALKGDMKGLWAVTVRANWRVVFRFEDGIAADVDLVDYH
jgi:toxin HigB-1